MKPIARLFADPPAPTEMPKPYLIAEAGVNHEGDLDLARRLIEEAADAGADAIKFQTYRANTIASVDSPAYWNLSKEPTRTQHELFKKYDRFWKSEFEQLKSHCDRVGIEFMSTPFDLEAADFLNELVDVFKVSSSDVTNKPFLEHIAGYGKPLILSTGASNLQEIHDAVGWIRAKGAPLALLHCVLSYPTADEAAHLLKIPALQREFPELLIGYSDHTLPGTMETLITASLLGARILEKHFTHDKTLPGNDHYHAMDKHDLEHFVDRLDATWCLLGSGVLEPVPEEEAARVNARRSLVAARPIAAGKIIGKDDLTWKRPGRGISPSAIEMLVGRVAAVDIPEDAIIEWPFVR